MMKNKKELNKKKVIELIEMYCRAYSEDLWDTFIQFVNDILIPKFATHENETPSYFS